MINLSDVREVCHNLSIRHCPLIGPRVAPEHGETPQEQANRAHAWLRSPGDRANAQLKTRRSLRELRCYPWRAGQLAKAIHVLQIHEANTG
jgi:hypothetical protein